MQHSPQVSPAQVPHPCPQQSPQDSSHEQESHAHAAPQQQLSAAGASTAGIGSWTGRNDTNSMDNVNMTDPFECMG
ncbi:MAG: hypothetical protein IT436_05630 [Phycisphaerales bacterium]|nr:hypothetical protein [Phycisphaerales bacterium]